MTAQDPVAEEDVESDRIVDAALDIIARGGLARLTLRPLAAQLGVSVAVISARMGSKDQLIDRAIDVAAQRDQRFGERWCDLAARIAPTDSATRAALADLAFRDWMTAGRRNVVFLIELVHDRALQDAASAALDRWLAQAGMVWSRLLFGTPALADLALGYMLDEASFALGAGDDPAYTLLRTLCLQRLTHGFARGGADGAAIERLIAALAPEPLPIARDDDPKRQRIADSAARIIVSQGMEATTHRSVALAADVPASTVVYHFGGRAALVVAGLHAVIARFHGTRARARAEGRLPADDAETRDLVKATSMIALASVRETSLQPYATDMRRRRGENIRATDLAALGFGPAAAAGFDRATAQVISIALFGMRMVAMARKRPERAQYRAAFAAFDAWDVARTDPGLS
ncbi:TetR family transcriptional regulator [Sphingomonas glacialis]|uniref:TetR family transcriptional regulator n=1 Tax=Sphingomonas glacialis TaxID=658225 RepID=UPI00112B532F|nr:TetR family transcriptional regulator [Sphingomonas glacialis]